MMRGWGTATSPCWILIKPINTLTLNTLLVDEVSSITAFHVGL